MDIDEAKKILQQQYARSWSIAKAWDIFLNKGKALDDEHYKRLELKHQFIEGLNLPLFYESVNDGFYPANEIPTGTSVKDIECRNSLCISVQSVYEAAIKANLPWPISPSNVKDKESLSELTSPTEAPAVTNSITHKVLKRSHYMGSPIKQARAIANNPNDVSEVWGLLKGNAQSNSPWSPMGGEQKSVDHITCISEKPFSRDALRKYLQRNPCAK